MVTNHFPFKGKNRPKTVEWVFDCCESKRKETKERRRRKSQDGANPKNTIDWEKEDDEDDGDSCPLLVVTMFSK